MPHRRRASWPDCTHPACPDPTGGPSAGNRAVTPARIDGRRVGWPGILCKVCYKRLYGKIRPARARSTHPHNGEKIANPHRALALAVLAGAVGDRAGRLEIAADHPDLRAWAVIAEWAWERVRREAAGRGGWAA